ncbi:MAG: thioesterase family protein [Alphaproteobacteria bacterium]|nr:thioesterase family protein [Alphaproteobacteria bacterium]
MKDSLKPGLTHTRRFVVTDAKTVPNIYPESEVIAGMPRVFATGFMVGLMEWACIELMRPHLDPGEGSLGIHIDVSHTAATPPGMTVTVEARVEAVDGKRIDFTVVARDDLDEISRGRHRRAVVAEDKFKARVAEKAAKMKRA